MALAEAGATGLGSLRSLPDWLARMVQPDRVLSALSAAVAEVAEGTLVLSRVKPGHFRLKGDRWKVSYLVTARRAAFLFPNLICNY